MKPNTYRMEADHRTYFVELAQTIYGEAGRRPVFVRAQIVQALLDVQRETIEQYSRTTTKESE